MKRIRRTFIVLVAVGLIVSLTMILPASARVEKSGVEVLSSEFVLATMDSAGDIEEVQVFNQLSLNGDGTVTVKEEAAFDDVGSYQGVKSFTTPSVEDGFIVWPEITVNGPASVIATTKLSETDVEEARTRIPLDVKFKYWFDGTPVTDLETITGKDGRFKMECTLRNTSKEKRPLRFEDPATGEMVTEMTDTYLPLVILPYDWYFDNSIFFNLECDPTGLVVPMPDFFNVGWSIPLFPPATEESHTIWVAADVKNFQMPPLTLSVNFVFPETNQSNPLAILGPAILQLYGGMVQVNDGLGTPETPDTLLYGITAVDDGINQLAAGLPTAVTNINDAMIPGVDQMVAGIGSPTTPNTLLYADTAAIAGLQGISAGIGSATTANTLLFAANALVTNLTSISNALGNASTAGTLINGVYSVMLGLSNPSGVPLPGVLQGLQQLSAGLTPVIAGLNNIQMGLANPANPSNVYNVLMGGVQQMTVNAGGTIRNLVDTSPTMAGGEIAALDTLMNTWGGNFNAAATGVQNMYNGLVAPYPAGIIAGLQFGQTALNNQLIPAVTQMYAGMQQIYAALIQINNGIGTTATPNTLLFAADAIAKGLSSIQAGIGGATVPNSLLYALAAIQGGLYQIKGGLSTGNMDDPGIKEGLVLISSGLSEAVTGLGSSGTPDTLAYGTNQIKGGLTDLSGGATQLEDGLAMIISNLNLTEAELEVIKERGEEFDHFLGRAQDAKNEVRFVYQSKPTYNYEDGSSTSWIVAIVLSVIFALGLVAGGILLGRRSTA